MHRYAVFGHPIAHSKSPWIHAQFAAQFGFEQTYEAIDAPPERFEETLWDFGEAGGLGGNVTLPLKEQAATLCDELSEAAQRARAVNTLIRLPDQRWRGENTDGVGLMTDLARLRVPLAGRRIVILGAGGATRGILAPLLAALPREIVIVNRTPEKALELAFESGALGIVQAWALDEIASLGAADVLIHATSAFRSDGGLKLPGSVVDADTIAYDLGYGASAAPFLAAMRVAGATAHDGLGMLVEQAAESFRHWRGVRPQTGPVLAALRKLIDA